MVIAIYVCLAIALVCWTVLLIGLHYGLKLERDRIGSVAVMAAVDMQNAEQTRKQTRELYEIIQRYVNMPVNKGGKPS